MVESIQIIVRPFDGSEADAEGLLSVERATFAESPYTAYEVQEMLVDGPQRAWLAVPACRGDPCGRPVGFVVAFLTVGQSGPSWEIDLLAVHPDWRGQQIGLRLIRAAAAGGEGLAPCARAVTADDNTASLRSFVQAGFSADVPRYELLICRPAAGQPRHTTQNPIEPSRPILLHAERGGRRAGRAELVEVQTLLYRGLWIESLTAQGRTERRALIERSVELGRRAGLDEIGALVSEHDRRLREAFLAAGFWSLGGFLRLSARLPLPKAGAGARFCGSAH